VLVGIRPIHHPPTFAGSSTRGVSPAAVVLRQICVLDADEMKLATGRKGGARTLAVLDPESLSNGREGDPENCGRYSAHSHMGPTQ
jgi:hypothetical protein